MGYKLGILDQSPIFPGTTAVDALQHTVHLAQKAEEWGYNRFWVSEHHHMKEVAGSSPEVLISYILAQTNSIQVGSGGVMLQHYSPYKVAENFQVLSALAPGRVDLGVGKAPGGFPLSTKALQFGTLNDGEDFEERVALLKNIIENSIDKDHPLAGIRALPHSPEKPGIYLLGASVKNAQMAAELGINFVFARFINNDDAVLEEAARVFRNKFRQGKFIVSVAVIAASTKQEAAELASHRKLFKLHLESGRTLTVQSREQAEAFEDESGEPFTIEELETHTIFGTASDVKKELAYMHQKYQVDEFILHTPLKKEVERFRSFELLGPFNSEGLFAEEIKIECVK